MLGLKKPGQVSPGVRNPEKPSDERHFSTPAAIASQQRHGEAHDTSRNRLPQIPFHFCLVTWPLLEREGLRQVRSLKSVPALRALCRVRTSASSSLLAATMN